MKRLIINKCHIACYPDQFKRWLVVAIIQYSIIEFPIIANRISYSTCRTKIKKNDIPRQEIDQTWANIKMTM